MRGQCQHMKETPQTAAVAAAAVASGQERTAQPTTGPPSCEDASVADGGGMAQLEAELRAAKARASNAEDLSRERGEACGESLRRVSLRMEQRT